MKKARFIFNRVILLLGLNVKEFIPFVGSIIDRGLDANITAIPTKDQLFQNCLFYPTKNPYTNKESIFVSRRIGMPASGTTDANFAEIEGFYYWKAVGTMVRYGYDSGGPGTQSRYNIVDSAGTSTAQTTGNNNRIFHVSEGKTSGGTNAVFLISAAIGNTYTTIYMFPDLAGVDTNITVPSGSCGHLAHMNDYVFIANTDGRIYNSTLNDPTTGYTDFIGVDMNPGTLVTVFRYKSYVVAFKTHSMELFRIGEQTTGSPLQRVVEGLHQIGIFKDVTNGSTWSSLPISAPPIVEGNDTIFWLGQGNDGLGVYTMEGDQPKKISDPFQDKYLTKYGGYFKYLVVGKRRLLLVYCTNEWLVLDIDSGIWSIWVSAKASDIFKTWCNTFNGEGLISASSNVYYTWTPSSTIPYLDIDSTITRKVRTSNIDFDNNELKDFPGLTILGARATSTSNIAVRWSKDDYQTWTSSKNVDMSSTYPGLYALGVGRRIAFEFSDTVQSEQRLRGFELDYNIRD